MKKNNTSKTTLAILGAGAVALAASSYYFFGPEGKIHRKKALGWMIKMKGEVVEKLSEASDVSEDTYHKIVDSVLASYVGLNKVAKPELEEFADSLKNK